MKRDRLVLLILVFAVVSCGIGIINAAIPNNTLRNNWLVITGVNVTGSYQIDGNDIITGAGVADFASVDADGYFLNAVNKTDILAHPYQPASYIISTDGTTIRAVNGTTGIVDYSGTNATTIIQAALDTLPISGGTVFLKEGTYSITHPITWWKDKISLIGMGPATILYRTNDASNLIEIGNGVNHTRYGKINGIYFQGDGHGTGHGIRMHWSHYFVITDNWFYYVNDGIHMDATGEDGESVDNHIISNNHFYETQGYGIYGQVVQNTVIVGNMFDSCEKQGIYLDTNTDHDTITGNTFEECGETGPVSQINVKGDYITITGNNLVYGEGHGILLTTAEDCTVSSNTVMGNKEHGIYLSACEDCVVVGNTVHANDLLNTVSWSGIKIHGSFNTIVSSNSVTDNDEYEIQVTSTSTNTTIIGNNVNGIDHSTGISNAGTNTIIRLNYGYTGPGDIRFNAGDIEMWNSTAWVKISP